MTPCLLELGGKCPFVVDLTADLDLAAGKLVMSKFGNCGQTCIAPDYVLVHEKHVKQFTLEVVKKIKAIYGENPVESEYLGKIINEFHTKRLEKLL